MLKFPHTLSVNHFGTSESSRPVSLHTYTVLENVVQMLYITLTCLPVPQDHAGEWSPAAGRDRV
jgi:hypothetical protein